MVSPHFHYTTLLRKLQIFINHGKETHDFSRGSLIAHTGMIIGSAMPNQ